MGSLIILKRKRMVMHEECDFILSLTIHSAEGIDTQTTDPRGDKRIYAAGGTLNHGREFWAPRAEGLPDPQWNWTFEFPLGGLPMDDRFGFLNLEVLRTGSRSDPGTSNGDVLVGKALIDLPSEINQKKRARIGLVRSKGEKHIAEGFLFITMEIKRIRSHFHH